MKPVATVRRENLDILAAELGTMEKVADLSGASSVYLSQIKKQAIDLKTGKPRQMGGVTARRLERGCGKPEGWMDADHSSESSTAPPTAQVVVQDLCPTPAPDAPVVHVPLLANAGSMGPGTDIEHDDVLVGSIALSPDWLDKRIRPTSFDALRFIHAHGDSMSPTFEDGDILLVDTGRRDPSCADGVYVLSTSKRLFIKRVTERFDGSRQVSSDNKNVTLVQELNGDHEINVLGRVVWVWNGRKL